MSPPRRHALPLFTSLLNAVCAYDPVGYGIPYNHLLFSDHRERLVEHALQSLIVTLETEGGAAPPPERSDSPAAADEQEVGPIAESTAGPETSSCLPPDLPAPKLQEVV